MDNAENTYCRFCAEPKTTEKVLNLDNDQGKTNEIQLKLDFLNALYVDVSNPDSLPKTVCFICYDSLNQAYEFLDRVKKAQDVLNHLFTSDSQKQESDDERITEFYDFNFLGDDDDVSIVKEELDKQTSLLTDYKVKIEPKEEITDPACLLQAALNSAEDNTDSLSNLNVEDIIDFGAVLCNAPNAPNVTIYAKDLADLGKKKVKTWREYPWVCAYCNIEFLDIVTLRSHSKVVHGKCSAFVCVDCKTYGKKDDFNSFVKHVRKHRKCLSHQCHYCDEPIDDTESMRNHVKKHLTKPQIPCPACGDILKNEDALRQHILEYLSVKPKRKPRRKAGTPITVEDLTCDICKKVYKNPNSLRDHIKRHTSDRKRNYTCDRCGKTFYNKGTLTSHIMSHDQIRPHLCRICNKSFLFPNMLRRHVEMHSGVKPYPCEQCGRRFRLQYQLNAHKIIHTDAMPYMCQYCNKAFRFKQILKNHERQHTGAKPYSCQNCGMEFSNWSNYNKHMKRRHGTDTSKKKITPEGVFPVNPETGQIMQITDQGTEEWKTKIMIPGKRGKKKIIKQENV